MASNTDDLRELFVEVTDEEEIVEHRAEERSHDPIEDDHEEFLDIATEDGLDDAVDGAEVSSDGSGVAG